MKHFTGMALVLGIATVLAATGTCAQATESAPRVFELVTHLESGSLDAASARLREAAPAAGWTLLADFAPGAPGGCSYGGRVFILYNPSLAQPLFAINPITAPFATVDRIVLFEDEQGMHAGIANPRSIDRTVLMDDPRAEAPGAQRRQALHALVVQALGGREDTAGYGQERDQGLIGKTMGVMAGGKFAEKIQDLATVPNADWLAVTAKLKSAMAEPGKDWGLHAAFVLELPEQSLAIIGSTGRRLESRSFEIVGAGSASARKDLQCPGLAHAAAYPLEIVVRQDGSAVRVQAVDAMFRMKMFFEDAGKMAFMKNMGMPGAIADEMKAQVRAALPELDAPAAAPKDARSRAKGN